MESPRMSFFEHLEEFKRRALRIFVVFLVFFALFITFSIRFVEVGGISIPYLWPDFFNSISVQVIGFSLEWYLPAFVTPVQITPAEAILVQFKVAMFLAVLASMPMIVYQLSKFVSPGLYEREKQVILKITVPATLLFLTGVLIAHFLILPFVFDFLYTVGQNIGLEPLARVDPVFDVVLLFFVGMGLAFQTPVIMWGLTALGVVDPEVFKKYWRYAVLGFFVFGAVITPDGSGLTMMLVALPMSVLYVVGYLLSVRTWRRREGPEEPRDGGSKRSSPAVWSAVILVGAVIVAFVWLGTPLLTPTTPSTPIASGTLDVTLPAFVLYSPIPLTTEMETGATLTAGAFTTVPFVWSASASDGTNARVELNVTPTGPFHPSSGGDMLTVLPTHWTPENLTSLRLAASGGSAGLYALNLSIAYTVFDVGGSLVVAYEPTPTSAAFVELALTPVDPPMRSEMTRLDRGRLTSLGPGWELSASLDSVRADNATFMFNFPVAEIPLTGRTLSLSLVRSFTWSPGEDLDLWIRGDTAAEFVYTWFVDDRFGSIYPVLEPA
ncbi:MAG: twin-arginine translocase subunit TatC [Thermoplasmata archaeon]